MVAEQTADGFVGDRPVASVCGGVCQMRPRLISKRPLGVMLQVAVCRIHRINRLGRLEREVGIKYQRLGQSGLWFFDHCLSQRSDGCECPLTVALFLPDSSELVACFGLSLRSLRRLQNGVVELRSFLHVFGSRPQHQELPLLQLMRQPNLAGSVVSIELAQQQFGFLQASRFHLGLGSASGFKNALGREVETVIGELPHRPLLCHLQKVGFSLSHLAGPKLAIRQLINNGLGDRRFASFLLDLGQDLRGGWVVSQCLQREPLPITRFDRLRRCSLCGVELAKSVREIVVLVKGETRIQSCDGCKPAFRKTRSDGFVFGDCFVILFLFEQEIGQRKLSGIAPISLRPLGRFAVQQQRFDCIAVRFGGLSETEACFDSHASLGKQSQRGLQAGNGFFSLTKTSLSIAKIEQGVLTERIFRELFQTAGEIFLRACQFIKIVAALGDPILRVSDVAVLRVLLNKPIERFTGCRVFLKLNL